MIRLLLNTIALEPNRWTPEKQAFYRLADLLGPIADAGFHGVECWQYHLSRETTAEVKRLRKQAEGLGLQIPLVGMYPRLHRDGAARRADWTAVQAAVKKAALLGAQGVKLFVGSKGSATLTTAEYDRSLALLADLVDLARSHGLIVTGETHPDTLFDTLDACRAVLDTLGKDALHVCFQPFDLADTPQALADYAVLHAHIVHVHYQGRKGGAMSLLADADLDYTALTAALAAHGFDGYLCIEFVKDCVVANPAEFDLARVLRHAQYDRDFVMRRAARHGMVVVV